jgi:hypothetical protein
VALALGAVVVTLVVFAGVVYTRGNSTGTTSSAVQILVAIGQTILAYAVAVATVFYAMKTTELVDLARAEAATAAMVRVDEAVDALEAAALVSASNASAVAGLLRRSWRWWLPAAARSRDRYAMAYLLRMTGALADALHASQRLAHLRPDLRPSADAVVDAAVASQEAATAGDMTGAIAAAEQLRAAITVLRDESSSSARHLDRSVVSPSRAASPSAG